MNNYLMSKRCQTLEDLIGGITELKN